MWAKVRTGLSRWRQGIVAGLLALTVLGVLMAPASRKSLPERIGDQLQVALPMIGWGCSAVNGKATEYAVRFAASWIATHGTKHGLGQAAINIRPNGGDQGFPSGHTSAAVYGASALVHECVTGNPWVQGAVILSAGFVGASRIEADKHNIWQVLAGALYGWIGDRALRRPSRARTAVVQGLRRVQGWIAAPFRKIFRSS
ncbi:phosphatase PAP2 family protein [Paragemmobacter straminiformis]|uniref:Phosphatase PAP2 family protein n=1 Tax=Paragemmobacter straminiformis TaxID=2045119 RepID=A0A842I7I3_9RHOB|nr:phosphatase PAP2 family protein [Gemmobacter straminiformis]MBC2834938.1 phosphatase PAP2 family protein [Gemmobacter straminiformis]